VVVEWVAERVVRGEWILLVSEMAVQVWELKKTWEAYMTLSHDCQTIFPHRPSQRHPLGGYTRIESKR
jgi:hypothetical protein